MKKDNFTKLISYFEGCFVKKLSVLTFALLLFTGVFQKATAGSLYSETALLTLHLRNTSIQNVLTTIEERSEFYFMYSSEKLDLKSKVDIDVENCKINDVLDKVLANSTIKYVIKDRQILLVPQESNGVPVQQQGVIKGKVSDTKGDPLIGVNVVVTGTTQGVITDINGEYSINVPAGSSSLTFSFIGMSTQTVEVGNMTKVDVVLQDEVIGLEGVVVVGYGTQKKSMLTGAISEVKSEKLNSAPMPSISQTLAGRLPGLVSKQTQGSPGLDDATISIRGFGAPLVIIDGVEGDFNRLNPNEVESVTILKDAAAAIYGSRAGNGVLLVTTKRGQAGKPTINFNYAYTAQTNTRFLKPESSGQYAELANEWTEQRGAGSAPYTQADIDKYYAGTDPAFPNTDWLDVATRKISPMNEYNLSVSGGSEKIKYYTFLGMLNQQAFFRSNDGDYNRYNVRTNIDAKITDNLTASMDLSSSISNRKFPYRAGAENGAFFTDLWSALPIYPGHLPDPDKYSYSGTVTQILAESERDGDGYRDNDNTNYKASLSFVYQVPFLKGLSLKAFGNYSKDFNFEKAYHRLWKQYQYDYTSQIYIDRASASSSDLNHVDFQNKEVTGQFSFNFERRFNDHYFNVLGLYEVIDYATNTISAGRQNFISPNLDYLFAGSQLGMTNSGIATEMGRASYIGRLNYSYKNKYLVDATLRHDASAKFPPDARWGTFPSVSLGWRLSEEQFVKDNIVALSNLKIRGGFSKTGNDAIGNFQYLSGYSLGSGMAFGEATQTDLIPKGLANPLLTWEEMTITNIGVDFSLWLDRLYGTIDVFKRNRDGIPGTRNSSLPSTFGSVAPVENLNSMTSQGFEVLLGTRPKIGDVILDISANISYNRAKWDSYDEPVYTDPDDIRLNKKTGNYVDRTIGYVSDGLFTSQAQIDALTFDADGAGNTTLRPGDINFKDLNNDGVLNWKDQDVIGSGGTPHWIIGTSVNATYKSFDLSVLFQGAWGYSVYNSLNGGLDQNAMPNASTALYDNRWTEENNNPHALVARIGSIASNRLYYTDFYLKTGAYLRLKTLSIGYNIPNNWLKSMGVEGLRVYFAGTNLLTLDKLKKYGVDPEASKRAV